MSGKFITYQYQKNILGKKVSKEIKKWQCYGLTINDVRLQKATKDVFSRIHGKCA